MRPEKSSRRRPSEEAQEIKGRRDPRGYDQLHILLHRPARRLLDTFARHREFFAPAVLSFLTALWSQSEDNERRSGIGNTGTGQCKPTMQCDTEYGLSVWRSERVPRNSGKWRSRRATSTSRSRESILSSSDDHILRCDHSNSLLSAHQLHPVTVILFHLHRNTRSAMPKKRTAPETSEPPRRSTRVSATSTPAPPSTTSSAKPKPAAKPKKAVAPNTAAAVDDKAEEEAPAAKKAKVDKEPAPASTSASKTGPLSVGDQLPDGITLKNELDEEVDISAALAEKG